MKYWKIFYFLLVACMISLAGCGDDDDDDNDDNGIDPGDVTEGTLVFTLDGEMLSFETVIASIVSGTGFGAETDGEILTLGSAASDGSAVLTIGVIDNEGIMERAYDLIEEEASEPTSGAIFSYVLLNEDLTSGTIYLSTDASSGGVTITEIDRNEQTISGTFSGTLISRTFDSSGNTVATESAEITDGAFNKVNYF